MTATILESDTDSQLFEDIVPQMSCQSSKGCSDKPDWSCETRCCADYRLLCDEHFWAWYDAAFADMEDVDSIVCPYCHTLQYFTKFSEWISANKI